MDAVIFGLICINCVGISVEEVDSGFDVGEEPGVGDGGGDDVGGAGINISVPQPVIDETKHNSIKSNIGRQ